MTDQNKKLVQILKKIFIGGEPVGQKKATYQQIMAVFHNKGQLRGAGLPAEDAE